VLGRDRNPDALDDPPDAVHLRGVVYDRMQREARRLRLGNHRELQSQRPAVSERLRQLVVKQLRPCQSASAGAQFPTL
jgi:hypothetical protein